MIHLWPGIQEPKFTRGTIRIFAYLCGFYFLPLCSFSTKKFPKRIEKYIGVNEDKASHILDSIEQINFW